MSNSNHISIIDFKEFDLKYILDQCNEEGWIDGQVAKSRYSSELGSDINKKIRSVDVFPLSNDFQSFLNNCIEPYVLNYANKHKIGDVKNTGYTLTRYSKGDFFTEHTDSTEEFPRKVSIILYLNDNYQGGTLTFTKNNQTFKPKANSIFIFPSTEDFSHSADPVLDGVKYVIVGFWK